jgi:hypothetical protein
MGSRPTGCTCNLPMKKKEMEPILCLVCSHLGIVESSSKPKKCKQNLTGFLYSCIFVDLFET